MSIHVLCPGCGARFDLPDGLRDKRVRCKKCDESFVATPAGGKRRAVVEPGEADIPEANVVDDTADRQTAVEPAPRAGRLPPPRRADAVRAGRQEPAPPPRSGRPRPPRRDEDDREQPRGGVPTGLVIAGIVAGVLLLGGVLALGAWFLLVPSKATPNNQVTEATPRPAPEKPKDPPGKEKPADPPRADPKPNLEPPPQPREPPVVAWTVKPDPLTVPIKVPADIRASIPVAGFSLNVLVPTSPSPFVAVGQNMQPADARQVWDLRTMKQTGTIRGQLHVLDPVLSPDGVYLAGRNIERGKPTAEVWYVADGTLARSIVLDAQPGFPGLIDFAATGQFVSIKGLSGTVTYQIWDIKTGTSLREFTAPSFVDRRAIAFSAGRRYLAYQDSSRSRLLILDLSAGTLAGEIHLTGPGQAGGLSCKALAFSPDGKELAGLFHSGEIAELLSWNMDTGQLAIEHKLAKDPAMLAQGGLIYAGHRLEWLPDRSGWLAYGQLLIDYPSGALVYTVPVQPAEFSAIRWVLDRDTLAQVTGTGNQRHVVFNVLPRARIDAAVQSARAGQGAAAAPLPPVKAADWSMVRTLPAPAGAVDWKAPLDPVPVARGKLGARPLLLRGPGADIEQILFSAADVGQALVVSAGAPNDLSTRKQVHLDRYDLVDGKLLGGADLFVADTLKEQPLALAAAVSPDGTCLATRVPAADGRIDLWSASDGKHRSGWFPYDRERGPARSVQWFAFLDARRLLTLSGTGQLVLWDVPECRAVYLLNGCRGAPTLSPGHKSLVVCNGATLEVYDPATGDRQGQLVPPAALQIQDLHAAAYRRDGKELAAVVRGPHGFTLTRWDMTNGASRADFPIRIVTGNDMKWCGPDHVLIGQTLVDLKLHWSLWTYQLPGAGRHATGSPDGRHWFAVSRAPRDPALLTAQTLPDASARLLTTAMANGSGQPLLAPGMTVAIRVDGAVPPGDTGNFRKTILDNLTARLTADGLKVVPGAARVVVSVQVAPERLTGEVRQMKRLGGRDVRNIAVREIDCQITASDSQGRAIFEHKHTTKTPAFAGIIETDDPEAYLMKATWGQCAAMAASLPFPSLLVRVNGVLEDFSKAPLLVGDR